MTQIFETKKFRVQIVGKSVWVETKDGSGWVFRSQHILPVALAVARGKKSTPVLRAAIDHYEKVNNGDRTLRAALTGCAVKQGPNPSNSRPARGVPVEPSTAQAPRANREAASTTRGPLRPPLGGLDIGLPQRA